MLEGKAIHDLKKNTPRGGEEAGMGSGGKTENTAGQSPGEENTAQSCAMGKIKEKNTEKN